MSHPIVWMQSSCFKKRIATRSRWITSRDYDLFLEGQKFLSGKKTDVVFRANETIEFPVPVTVRYLDFFKTSENLVKTVLSGSKTVRFQLKMVVTIYFLKLPISIPVNANGELPLPDVKAPKSRLKL